MSGPGQVPFLDTGNPLLAQVPVRLECGTVTGQGTAATGVLTLRSATTTMSVLLSADDLRKWAKIISDLSESLGGSGPGLIKATAADISSLGKGNGRPRLA